MKSANYGTLLSNSLNYYVEPTVAFSIKSMIKDAPYKYTIILYLVMLTVFAFTLQIFEEYYHLTKTILPRPFLRATAEPLLEHPNNDVERGFRRRRSKDLFGSLDSGALHVRWSVHNVACAIGDEDFLQILPRRRAFVQKVQRLRVPGAEGAFGSGNDHNRKSVEAHHERDNSQEV